MSNGIFWLTVPDQVSPVKRVYAPAQHLHVTLKFNVSFESVKKYLDREVNVELLENCWNKEIQAITVKLPTPFASLCNNKNPHMTISHKSGVRPVKSNDMLDGEYTSEPIKVKKLILKSEFYMFNIREK